MSFSSCVAHLGSLSSCGSVAHRITYNILVSADGIVTGAYPMLSRCFVFLIAVGARTSPPFLLHAPAGIGETKVEVTKDELSKLMSVGTELAKEIQQNKRSWVPKSDDKNKDKDKKGKKGGKKKGVNEVDAEESTPTTTSALLSGAPAAKGPS